MSPFSAILKGEDRVSTTVCLAYMFACVNLFFVAQCSDARIHSNNERGGVSDVLTPNTTFSVGPRTIEKFSALSSSIWIAVDVERVVWRTENRGITWVPIKEGKYRVSNLSIVDAQTLYLVIDGLFLRSADLGLSWEEVSQVPGDVVAISFLNAAEGVLIADVGESHEDVTLSIFTADGGRNWRRQSIRANNKSTSIDSIFYAQRDLVFAAGREGVFVTYDTGGTWAKVPKLSGSFDKIEFRTPSIGWLVETIFSASQIPIDSGRSWTRLDLPQSQSGSTFFIFENRTTVVLDSRGYVQMKRFGSRSFVTVGSYSKDWASMVNKDEIGQAFIEPTPDGAVVLLWFLDGKSFSIATKDCGETWF